MQYVVPVISRTKFAAFRRYTVAEFEKAADDFAKKRFGCGGTLPDRLVEVRCCFDHHPGHMQPELHGSGTRSKSVLRLSLSVQS
jgi:hypothetical protein